MEAIVISSQAPPTSPKLREAAQKLEAAFLAEMLKSSGLGAVPDGFGGGAGEDHFVSFLRDAQAREMARAGGLGLTAIFVEHLKGDFHDQAG